MAEDGWEPVPPDRIRPGLVNGQSGEAVGCCYCVLVCAALLAVLTAAILVGALLL